MYTAQRILFALSRLLSSYEKTYTLSSSKKANAKSLGRSSHKALFQHVSHCGHCDLKLSMLRQVGEIL